MPTLLHEQHPFRIFWFSVLATLGALVGVYFGLGIDAFLIAAILIVVEITFSFENAIINARILAKMSRFWQTIFLTIGIVIAIFGMRIIFPIAIVMITAGLDWFTVINLAFQSPEEYSKALESAHSNIAAFGGTFLLMLAFHFFFNKERKILWFPGIEKWFQKYASFWAPFVSSTVILGILALLPINKHPAETFTAGMIGIVTYTVLQILIHLFEKIKNKSDSRYKNRKKAVVQTGVVAFTSFIYLEVLDASFSFDSVIGAFAITTDVLLIAIGLGVGAIWVRSLTIFMVRRGTLNAYRYLEHGAHYTVFALAGILLMSMFVHVPEVIAGSIGIVVITASIIASVAHRNRRR